MNQVLLWLIYIGLLPEPSTGTPEGAYQIAIWAGAVIALSCCVYHIVHRSINKKEMKTPLLITVLSVLLVVVFTPGLQPGILAMPILAILGGGWLGYKNSGQ